VWVEQTYFQSTALGVGTPHFYKSSTPVEGRSPPVYHHVTVNWWEGISISLAKQKVWKLENPAPECGGTCGSTSAVQVQLFPYPVVLDYGIAKPDLPEAANPRHVVFIDMCHSNFSVVVAAFSKGQSIVKSTAYDRRLGGKDIDYALVQHFAEEFRSKYRIDVLSNPKATQALSRMREAQERPFCQRRGVLERRIYHE